MKSVDRFILHLLKKYYLSLLHYITNLTWNKSIQCMKFVTSVENPLIHLLFEEEPFKNNNVIKSKLIALNYVTQALITLKTLKDKITLMVVSNLSILNSNKSSSRKGSFHVATVLMQFNSYDFLAMSQNDSFQLDFHKPQH